VRWPTLSATPCMSGRDHPRRAPVLAVFPFIGKHIEPFHRAASYPKFQIPC
jgi:hypothetical protein